jgi:hypothetical protein
MASLRPDHFTDQGVTITGTPLERITKETLLRVLKDACLDIEQKWSTSRSRKDKLPDRYSLHAVVTDDAVRNDRI